MTVTHKLFKILSGHDLANRRTDGQTPYHNKSKVSLRAYKNRYFWGNLTVCCLFHFNIISSFWKWQMDFLGAALGFSCLISLRDHNAILYFSFLVWCTRGHKFTLHCICRTISNTHSLFKTLQYLIKWIIIIMNNPKLNDYKQLNKLCLAWWQGQVDLSGKTFCVSSFTILDFNHCYSVWITATNIRAE